MISICLATYNGEKYIREQLDSILSQIAPDDEVIISDDGSTDATIDIIKSLRDCRIKIFFNGGKHGFKFNFENALKNAKGDYIFMSDQDDVWFPNKYQIMCRYLKEYDMIHHNSELTDGQLKAMGKDLYTTCDNRSGFFHNLKKNTYYGSHMAFRSSLLKNILPFPRTLEIGHDVWIGFVGQTIGDVFFTEEKLMYYRRHEGAYCALFKSDRPLYKKILTRIVIFCYEIKFILQNMRIVKWNKLFSNA